MEPLFIFIQCRKNMTVTRFDHWSAAVLQALDPTHDSGDLAFVEIDGHFKRVHRSAKAVRLTRFLIVHITSTPAAIDARLDTLFTRAPQLLRGTRYLITTQRELHYQGQTRLWIGAILDIFSRRLTTEVTPTTIQRSLPMRRAQRLALPAPRP